MEITIKIGGQAVSVEVSIEVYECLKVFDHKAENLRHQQRRHWDMREFNEYIICNESSHNHTQTPEEILCRNETLHDIMAMLASCTKTQRQRFLLYALEGMSFSEIARLQGCSKTAISDSIKAVRKKYQDYFK